MEAKWLVSKCFAQHLHDLSTDLFTGQLLAIGWDDGSVRLIGAESTKVVHQFTTGAGKSGISCVGWVSNSTKKHIAAANGPKASGSWGNLLADDVPTSEEPLHGDGVPLNLPRDLSQIDIETSLPKLSVLASGGSS
jgi:anaphase-promoting complex subunit 4